MRLPKFIGNRITHYVDEEDYKHQLECYAFGANPRDVDPDNELPLTLNICFPEHMEPDGLYTYRTIDWGECWATVSGPMYKWRCKSLSWHCFGMFFYGTATRPSYASCVYCGHKRYNFRPRWAR
jgi:hypothetical protein